MKFRIVFISGNFSYFKSMFFVSFNQYLTSLCEITYMLLIRLHHF
jgi:hypothetical protein